MYHHNKSPREPEEVGVLGTQHSDLIFKHVDPRVYEITIFLWNMGTYRYNLLFSKQKKLTKSKTTTATAWQPRGRGTKHSQTSKSHTQASYVTLQIYKHYIRILVFTIHLSCLLLSVIGMNFQGKLGILQALTSSKTVWNSTWSHHPDTIT